ncbi:MAG: glycosyltransferase family 4 protein [Desulfobacterota bacterium]|nr:glycosyltransferase family 4 protein [Thermodesulfobacteriota bacterium]
MNAPIRYADFFNSLAFIGTYMPRHCGIATFTSDLLTAVAAETTPDKCFAVAMNDIPEGYFYPPAVRFEVNQNKLSDYRRAADFLNMNQVDIVCLQHEYGIFGGPAGSNILELLSRLRMPIITTLHTVLKTPTPEQAEVLRQIVHLSDKIIIMSNKAKEFLTQIHNVPEDKIVFIHHGIPDTAFIDPNYFKDQFGVEGKKVILTFGLLSPNKGIENMIQAMPRILEKHPDAVYIILGATHPHVIASQGEGYRISLQQMAKRLNVAESVIFQNRFVSMEELCEFLGTADIYVTPYLSEEQITSGTLAYALGTGKATVSTPYWYAQEMLAEGRGKLVPFRDPHALAEAIIYLLDNDLERNAMRKRAYMFCRSAIWKEVARQYLEVFANVKIMRATKPRSVFYIKKTDPSESFELPDINLQHMQTLTDDTGILQHAVYTMPNRNHGYCTDDNARALIVTAAAKNLMLTPEHTVEKLFTTYLSFLHYAFNEETGRFRNFMTYDRRWTEAVGSEDSHGRSLWGLGTAVAHISNRALQNICASLFCKALKRVEEFSSPRALSFSLIGIHAYLSRFPGDTEAKRIRTNLAYRLFDALVAQRTPSWPWLETTLSYANGRIPHALILSGQWIPHAEMLDAGVATLRWLCDIQFLDGHFVPIGNNGWYTRDGQRARFDQQPIEAHVMIDACIEAYNATQDKTWIDKAITCFNWFLGNNDLGIPLYNPRTGGCRDGLMPNGINENEGAESTLAWLLSLIAIHTLRANKLLNIPAVMRSSASVV